MSRSTPKQRKGRVVEHVKNDKTKREGTVRLDSKAMIFFARLPDEEKTADLTAQTSYFESADGKEVKRWLVEQLQKADMTGKPLEWIAVIEVSVEEDDGYNYGRDGEEERQVGIKADIDRYHIALSLDKSEWVRLNWEQLDKDATEFVAEADRLVAAKHYGHGPKYLVGRDSWNKPDIFTLPSVSNDRSFVRYTDDLWAGLNHVFDNLENSRKTIQQLLGTKKGLLILAEVGAGAKRLTSGEISATDTTTPES